MMSLIDEYGITTLDIFDKSNELANPKGVVPIRSRLDGVHIAIASINELDCVLSYNYQYINRIKTKLLTERINHEKGYVTAVICTAKEVLEDD